MFEYNLQNFTNWNTDSSYLPIDNSTINKLFEHDTVGLVGGISSYFHMESSESNSTIQVYNGRLFYNELNSSRAINPDNNLSYFTLYDFEEKTYPSGIPNSLLGQPHNLAMYGTDLQSGESFAVGKDMLL